MNPGDVLDGWSLVKFLGQGSNAEVWVARRGETEAALKVLKTRNADSEPYRRFRQEIKALQAVGAHPGVLPVIDASLPERPSRSNRAWLALPVAIPIRDALRDAPVPEVVSAMANIAETLADLHDRYGLSHRDLKPANLYQWVGRWVVGDFGLVDLPGQEELTQPDRPLGPVNYLPYEMLVSPDSADPGPADVFSLAKVVWVLATGQSWPPQGEQPVSNPALSISQYRAHSNVARLDSVLERATRHDPNDRPTMRSVADDLRAWLELSSGPPSVPDLSAIGRRLRAAAAPRLTETERTRQLEALVATAADRLARLLRPLEHDLKEEFKATDTDAYNEFAESMLKYRPYGGMPQLVAEEIRATVIQGPGDFPVEFFVARKVGVTDDGLQRLAGICYVGHQSLGGGETPWQVEFDPVPADSLLAERQVDALAQQIIEGLPSWLEVFLARLGDLGHGDA